MRVRACAYSLCFIPINNLYSICNCLLRKNPGKMSPYVTKNGKHSIGSCEHLRCYGVLRTLYKMYKCVTRVYNTINVITVTCTSDTVCKMYKCV